MSRFDVDRFEVPPDAELVCCICQGVLDSPKETPCRHVFCKVCIETWLEKHRTCPTCRGITRQDQLKNVLPLLQNMINRLRLRCVNQANGCNESWTTEHFPDDHDAVCTYKKIKCRHRICQREFIRKHLATHEANCDYAEGACAMFCGLTVFVKKMRTHSCLDALKAKVDEQQQTITDQTTEIKRLKDEAQSLRDQLQQQDNWGDYYSDDEPGSGWESWTSDTNSPAYPSNDNDSMVGFSENSEAYESWSPTYRGLNHVEAVYDVSPRSSPLLPATGQDSSWGGPQGAFSDLVTSANTSRERQSTPVRASDHTYYSQDDQQSDDSHYSRNSYGRDSGAYNDRYSNYGSGNEQESQWNGEGTPQQDDQNSNGSWRSGSRTPVASEASYPSWPESRPHSADNSDDSMSESSTNSSGSRIHNNRKFSHVNTSASSGSDSEPAGSVPGQSDSTKSPEKKTLCVSDDRVTSSGLVENCQRLGSPSNNSRKSTKRKNNANDSDLEPKQGFSKRLKTSLKTYTQGQAPQSGLSNDAGSSGINERESTPRLRRSPRRPKPVKDVGSITPYSDSSSDSDASYRTPTNVPSDVTISDEQLSEDMSDADHEIFETVDKLLDRYCEESESNDDSWTPSY